MAKNPLISGHFNIHIRAHTSHIFQPLFSVQYNTNRLRCLFSNHNCSGRSVIVSPALSCYQLEYSVASHQFALLPTPNILRKQPKFRVKASSNTHDSIEGVSKLNGVFHCGIQRGYSALKPVFVPQCILQRLVQPSSDVLNE